MDFSKVDYSTLTGAHAGFKGGLDKSHPNRVAILAAIEKEIIKRRQRYVELAIKISEGEALSQYEVPVPTRTSFAPPPIVPTDATLDAAMKHLGIRSKVNATGDTLTGYKPSRPKYPFTYTGARGGRWKASIEQTRARFGSV